MTPFLTIYTNSLPAHAGGMTRGPFIYIRPKYRGEYVGPWTMKIPKAFLEHRHEIAYIDIVGSHRCHGLWTQETYYGSIKMDQLP